MSKKRIAMVMPWQLPLPPVHGGAVETLVQGLIDENERSQKLELTVFTKADAAAEALYGQYKHTRFVPIRVSRLEEKLAWLFRGGMNKVFHYPHTPGLAYLLRLCAAMRGQKFDRVVVQNQAAFTPMLARLQPGKIDVHMHNIVILSEMYKPGRTARLCDRAICVSDYISRWMQKNVAMSAEQCRLLLNCVDVPAFRAGRSRREEIRARLGVAENELLLLFTGRMCPEKGALELAQAFARANLPGVKLAFVGSAWFGANVEDDYLRSIRKTLAEVEDRVIFTGYVAHAEIPAYYAAADIALMPSVWDEPGALTVLEAQAAGVPVVTTLSGGIPQNVCPEGAVLLERGDGLVARLVQAITALAGDENRRRAMSEAALVWSEERNMNHYYDNFVSLMDEKIQIQ